jgi:hypothetical protein
MMKYKLPLEHLEQILKYLVSRPYEDVFQLVEFLKQAEQEEKDGD